MKRTERLEQDWLKGVPSDRHDEALAAIRKTATWQMAYLTDAIAQPLERFGRWLNDKLARRAGAGGGGGTRSRQRAARAGARVAAAGYALRAGDAAALRALGLDLAALAGLSPSQQAQRIVDVIVGTAATFQDVEVARASATMIIRLLESEVEPAPAEVLRIFATEYVYEAFMTELGSTMRDGARDGAAGVVTEDDIHDLIEAKVASLQIEGTSVDANDLEAALNEVLEFTRRIIHERPNE